MRRPWKCVLKGRLEENATVAREARARRGAQGWRWELVLCLAPLLVAACGKPVDPDGIAGMYHIERQTLNEAGCTEGPQSAEPVHRPYLRLERQEKDGGVCYADNHCETEDPGTCMKNTLCRFKRGPDGGWVTSVTVASGPGNPCLLTYSEQRLVLATDGGLRIEARSHSGEVVVPDGKCHAEEAEKQGPSLPCTSLRVQHAVRIE
jgi:hypothetical protein